MKHLKFILPSIIGVTLFLIPFPLNGNVTVLFGHINKFLGESETAHDVLKLFALVLMFITAICSLLGTVVFPKQFKKTRVSKIFVMSPVWFTLTFIGSILYILVYFGAAPAIILDEYTGTLVLNDFIPGLLVTFLVGNLILPLLMDFGLLEFLGGMLSRSMRFLFKVPGRSAIDAVSSVIGDGTLGIMVTDDQYEKGKYTRREAVVIATCFSIVGIATAAYAAGVLGFADGVKFLAFYGTILVTTVVVAIVIARLPLIKIYEDVTINGEEGPAERKMSFKHTYKLACESADDSFKNIGKIYKRIGVRILEIYFTLVPLIMIMGTVALVLSEYTPVFTWLSFPFVPLLHLLQIPEAAKAAPGLVGGFADMYVPIFLVADIASDVTRFTVGVIAFIQLIFMAETGTVLLKSSMKISFFEVVMFFLLRTLIALPIVAGLAHLFNALGLI